VIKTFLQEIRKRVDRSLDEYLPKPEGFGGRLFDAMRYSVFSGGKRLRPCLCLMVNSALRGEDADCLPAAAALEMIHAYSLIHDDLPAMDDDDFRHGKPSCHKAYGEATAILAGDGLLTLAFETIAKHTPHKDRINGLIAVLSEAAGVRGMVLGQMRDLESENKTPELDIVKAIHKTKTAAMISAAFRLGALCAGADEHIVIRLGEAGEKVGLAFQVIDDILDIEASTEQLGKTAGKDINKGKMTWPAAVGLDVSKDTAKKLTDEACELLELEGSFDRITELVKYMLHRTF